MPNTRLASDELRNKYETACRNMQSFRDRIQARILDGGDPMSDADKAEAKQLSDCLLYTSDAADE